MSKKHLNNNIAFLVTHKNALRCRQFLETHLEDLSSFTIIATLTEGKELESVSNVKVQYVPSLELGGCNELAHRVKKGQVSAVFVFNPSAVFSVDFKIQPLLDACWLSDTHICFNIELIDFVFSQLAAAAHNKKDGINSKKQAHSKAEQALSGKATFTLQNQLATFDRPTDLVAKAKRDHFVSKCAIQQLEFLFPKIHHEFLPMNDLLNLYINRDMAKAGSMEPFKELHGIGTYFDFNQSSFLRLKACPLDWSIKFLTLGEGADLRKFWDYETFKRDFLITHHVFISSVDLVRALKHFFKLGQPAGLDEDEVGDLKPAPSVISVVQDWILMEFGADFQENDDLAREMENFIKDEMMKYDANVALELQQLLHAAITLELPFPLTSEQQKLAPRPIVPKKMKFDEIPFWSLNPLEVARQMALFDENLFHKILAKEFLGGAWTKPDAMVRAPNLTKFIAHTNRMANFVVTEIINERTCQNIAECITFWIKVGEAFQQLKDYNGIMNVLTALHSMTVGRLRAAWDEIKPADKELFETLTESLSLLGHFKNYREEIRNIKDPLAEPIIPLIAVTCSDLNGLGEVLDNKTEEGWINFDKHQKFAEHIWSVKRFMRARYNFKVVPEIKNYIEKAKVLSPQEHGEKILSLIGKYRNDFSKDDAIIKAEKDRSLKPEFVPAVHTEITDKDWQTLDKLTKGQAIKYSKGEIILDFGMPNKYFYRVKKGSVRGELSDLLKKENVTTFKEKSFFGELGLINENSLSTFAYIADEHCEVIRIDIRVLAQELSGHPVLSEKINKVLSAKLAEKLKNFGKTPDTQHSTRQITLLPGPESILSARESQKDEKELLKKESSSIFKNKKSKAEKKEKDQKEGEKQDDKRAFLKRGASSRNWKSSESQGELTKLFKLQSDDPVQHVFECTFKNCVGKLFITKKFFYFYGSAFGRRIKETFLLSKISCLMNDEKKDTISMDFNEIEIVLSDFGKNHAEAWNVINSIITSIEKGQPEEEVVEDIETEEEISILNLTDKDWDRILEAARPTHYAENKVVVSQDQEQQQRIYHIDKGSCKIEKELEDGQTIQIATIQAGTIFGEISFLEGTGSKASATVTAAEATIITVIEGFYLDILFDYFPGLNGRFYHYLASELFKRLNHRYISMNDAQLKRSPSNENFKPDSLYSIISATSPRIDLSSPISPTEKLKKPDDLVKDKKGDSRTLDNTKPLKVKKEKPDGKKKDDRALKNKKPSKSNLVFRSVDSSISLASAIERDDKTDDGQNENQSEEKKNETEGEDKEDTEVHTQEQPSLLEALNPVNENATLEVHPHIVLTTECNPETDTEKLGESFKSIANEVEEIL